MVDYPRLADMAEHRRSQIWCETAAARLLRVANDPTAPGPPPAAGPHLPTDVAHGLMAGFKILTRLQELTAPAKARTVPSVTLLTYILTCRLYVRPVGRGRSLLTRAT
jgi:hypothetical protein